MIDFIETKESENLERMRISPDDNPIRPYVVVHGPMGSGKTFSTWKSVSSISMFSMFT